MITAALCVPIIGGHNSKAGATRAVVDQTLLPQQCFVRDEEYFYICWSVYKAVEAVSTADTVVPDEPA